MTESKLNKVLYTDITNLKLCNKSDAPVQFLLEKSPFNDDDDDDDQASGGPKKDEHLIIGRIFPKSDIYKDASYKIEMKLTNSFPLNPPEVRFLTPVYHPNVAKDGTFCHELLKVTSQWKPNKSLVDVVKAVVDQIDHPDVNYAFSFDVGKEYAENRTEFNRKATDYVQRHGLPRN